MSWALDLGSTSLKCCGFDLGEAAPSVIEEFSLDCPLRQPKAGWVEHDLSGMADRFALLLQRVPKGQTVVMASAMHALVLLDGDGKPLCDALSWADGRSALQAEELQQSDPQAYARTGTPLHPMAWPAKLLWVAQERPQWWARLSRMTDLKSFLWEKVTGQVAPLDRSSATGTGLWNRVRDGWDESLCERLQLNSELLPQVREGHRLVFQGRTLHLGGADGPLANLGVGAVGPGRLALSVGTSGAVRRYLAAPHGVRQGLFLYALGQLGWVEGGAINNGGSVMSWLTDQIKLSVEDLFEAAQTVEPGAEGLRVYPYFLGERAPFWRSDIQARVVGKTDRHTWAHLARATLEGVAFCLQRLIRLMDETGSSEPLRCTGGMFSSSFWTQLLADVTNREISSSTVDQATALGAALTTQADPLERSLALPLGPLVAPRQAEVYRNLYDEWQEQEEEGLVSGGGIAEP